MDGSLYAGIGDYNDPDLGHTPTLGAQVLRLDSATGSWVEDQNFIPEVTTTSGTVKYEAISALGTAHFDHDSSKNPITPVDVLMAGLWDLKVSGTTVAQKTVTTGSVGAQGTWTVNQLSPLEGVDGETRSFGSYTDSVTGEELAFAGSEFGIFSGGFNTKTSTVQWTGPERGLSR